MYVRVFVTECTITNSSVSNKKKERLIGRRLFGVVWETLRKNITLMLRTCQLWKRTFSEGRDVFTVLCSWAGKKPSSPGLEEVYGQFDGFNL